jgi:hypothetical protein
MRIFDPMRNGGVFDGHLRQWVRAACQAWGCPEPKHEDYDRVDRRLPEGVPSLVLAGPWLV